MHASTKAEGPEGPPPLFAVERVALRYGEQVALRGVTLDFPRGVTALIGPSGCGKSSLVRLLCGLVRPDAGQVRFAGAPLPGGDALRAVRRRIGYVIQEGGLFPHLSAAENVTLAARHLGWPSARIAGRLEALAALTRLSPAQLERHPDELSGGQRQRVSLMRALMLEPEALLLDEPLGALDPMIRDELQAELEEIFSRLQVTVVLVTHDLAEAARLSRRLVLMRDGRIVQTGSLEALRTAPADDFVRRFLRAQHAGVGEATAGAAPDPRHPGDRR